MPKGGARVRSGPAPDPNALRREKDGKDWVSLPAKREGPLPPWPRYMSAPNEAELAMWEELWEKPQALVWEADHLEHTVAVYVRLFIECSQRNASAQRGTLMRQREDGLLLSASALAAARYVIKTDGDAAPAPAPRASRSTSSIRAGLTVVPPTGTDGAEE